MHALFDTRSIVGQRLWRVIRQNMGWPDPMPIGISDRDFILAVYGRGCDRCDRHPRVRTPIWEFRGVRLCAECRERHTVRDYELGIPRAWHEHLPSVLTEGFGKFGFWSYRSYWTADLPSTEPAPQEIAAGREHLARLADFTEAVAQHRRVLEEEKRRKNDERRAKRRREVDAFLAERMPDLHPDFYRRFETYCSAVESTRGFTKWAQSGFLKKLLAELPFRRERIAQDQARAHALVLCRLRSVRFAHLEQLEGYRQATALLLERCSARNEFPTLEAVEAALADLLPLVAIAIQKRRTQDRWIAFYSKPAIEEELKRSSLYEQADPTRERDFELLARRLSDALWTDARRLYSCRNCGFSRRVGATYAAIAMHFAQGSCCEDRDLGTLR
jgi:hypothetical protein